MQYCFFIPLHLWLTTGPPLPSRPGYLGKRFIESTEKLLGILLWEDHWRLEFQHVVVRSVRLEEYLILKYWFGEPPTSPVILTCFFSLAQTCSAAAVKGSRVSRFFTRSMPKKSPLPRTSPIIWRLNYFYVENIEKFHLIFLRKFPGALHQEVADVVCVLDQILLLNHIKHGRGDGTADGVPWISWMILVLIMNWTSPPYVLKYSTPVASKLAAISGVVITAPTGWPLPIGLAAITIKSRSLSVTSHQ